MSLARYTICYDIAEGKQVIYISPVSQVITSPYGCKRKFETFIGRYDDSVRETIANKFFNSEIICTF